MNKWRAFKGDGDEYGVEDSVSVLYEPLFNEAAANRIAELYNGKNPPKDWYATEAILEKEGLLEVRE